MSNLSYIAAVLSVVLSFVTVGGVLVSGGKLLGKLDTLTTVVADLAKEVKAIAELRAQDMIHTDHLNTVSTDLDSVVGDVARIRAELSALELRGTAAARDDRHQLAGSIQALENRVSVIETRLHYERPSAGPPSTPSTG